MVQEMENTRDEFNRKIGPAFRKSHIPQCRKCYAFYPWGKGNIEVHHIKMLCDGGTNEEENLVVLCKNCHDEYHMHCEQKDFSTWVQKPPLWAYSAIAMIENDEVRAKALHSVDEMWGNIADARMTAEPWKDDECRKYVKANAGNWIDW